MPLPNPLLPLILALAVTRFVHAFIRIPCSQLVTERFDPLVTPGMVSPHVHQVVGGNAFNLTVHPILDLPTLASCTSCRVVEDKSNYWTAAVYFRHRNGSFVRVPQMANHHTGPGIMNGGMTVYYFQPRAPTKNLTIVPFQKGFRMTVGHPTRRSPNDVDPSLTEAKATSFRCFEDPLVIGEEPPASGPQDSVGFPRGMCPAGIRSNIYFPQCWDGINLDSEDHMSHVAHPSGEPSASGLQFFGTDCPPSHPVRLPLLFLEIVWDTRPFNDPEMWPEDGSQPFVFSIGDPTGFGQHADYVFGWEGDALQRAMDVCTLGDGIITNCPVLTVQTMDEMNACRLPALVPEPIEEQYIPVLPGCNPIQPGPPPATAVVPCDSAPSTTTPPPVSSSPPPAIVTPPWTVCHEGPGSEPKGLFGMSGKLGVRLRLQPKIIKFRVP